MSTTDLRPPLADRRRWAALAVLCAATLMVILDGTVVSVALPVIGGELGFSRLGVTWVMDAYLTAFAGLLLLGGGLGDRYGRRRLFLIGLAVFTAASAACGAAWDPAVLVVARFAQGAGGAFAAAVALGMVALLFSEPAERARAFAAFSFVGAAGAAIGLAGGGILTQWAGWRWVFLVNLPLGAVSIGAALWLLPRDRRGAGAPRTDAVGAVLATAGLMAGVAALVQTSVSGDAGSVSTSAVVAVVLLGGFVVRQATAHSPLVPVRLLRSRSLMAANAVLGMMIAALFGFQVLLALQLQRNAGYSPAGAGLALLPSAVVIAVVSLGGAARAIARLGHGATLAAGLGTLTLALALLVRLPGDVTYWRDVLPTVLLVGGFGLAMPAVTDLGMRDAAESDAGLASALFNTTQQLGSVIGLAALTAVTAAYGPRAGFGSAALLLAVALVVSLAAFRPRSS